MPLIKDLIQKISNQNHSSRVAINTLIIYSQRFSSALLSLISTPIVLNSLGVEDYGLFTLTVGFVGMLAFINWSLSSASQRYIAFSLGANDNMRLRKVFFNSLLIHAAFATIVLLSIFLFAGIITDNFLSIPESRVSAAKLIIRIVSIITFINILTVPFTGLLSAHENFLYLSIVGITESVLKLLIAISLIFIDFDKLIVYALLLSIVTILVFFLNLSFSLKYYSEANFKLKNLDRSLINEMISFSSWNFLGSIAIMSRNQGVAVLLNIFFGVVVNAAYGIAMQVSSAIAILSQGIIGSISPQIVKSAGSGNKERMIYLMRTMSKLAVLSVSFVAIPILFEAPLLLRLWLKSVPEGAILFSRLVIVFGLIMLLSAGINNVFNAIGKVKEYNLWISIILMLNLPLAYILFKFGYPSYVIILTGMFLEIISFVVRIFLLRKFEKFSIRKLISDLINKIGIPIAVSTILVLLVRQLGLSEITQLVVTIILVLIIYPILIYTISLDQAQKEFVITVFKNTYFRFIRK